MSRAMARFEVVAGRAIGMSVLVDDELLIGRHADGAGRLADDEEISRSHARISLDRSGFCAIEDLGSTNGTFVNGLRISGPQTLSVGDTIEMGGTTLVVRELPVPTADRALKAVHPQPTVAPRSSSQETPSIARAPSSRLHRPLHAADRPPAERITNLSLTLHVDLSAREATVSLGDTPEPIKLVFDGEAWRPASS